MATFEDTEGASISVWQPNEHRGAQVVNEHGSVNFNDLNTRDVEAAKSFYGSLCSAGRRSRWRGASRCGPSPAMATSSTRSTRGTKAW